MGNLSPGHPTTGYHCSRRSQMATVRRSVLPVPWLVRFRDIDHLSTALMEVHIEGERDRASRIQVDPGFLGSVGPLEEAIDLLNRFRARGGTPET